VRLSTSSRYRDDIPEFISAAQAEYAISLLRKIGFYLLPSFLAERWSGEVPSSKKIPATAYLNGVRGIAAFCVFIQHYTNEYYMGAQTNGYHAKPGDVWIVQLPFLRLMYSGGFMVTIFFVLSGFVLSYKPLQLVRAHDDVGLLNNLASSIFRRGPRLFLPLVPPMLIASTCIYLGLYGLSQHPKEGWLLETTQRWYLGQLLDTWWTFCQVINPFDSAWHWPNTIPPPFGHCLLSSKDRYWYSF
jgi:peptidoglycan/LPS O-acetylase OafA/YrhL